MDHLSPGWNMSATTSIASEHPLSADLVMWISASPDTAPAQILRDRLKCPT
jgi:hypothetical protein